MHHIVGGNEGEPLEHFLVYSMFASNVTSFESTSVCNFATIVGSQLLAGDPIQDIFFLGRVREVPHEEGGRFVHCVVPWVVIRLRLCIFLFGLYGEYISPRLLDSAWLP